MPVAATRTLHTGTALRAKNTLPPPQTLSIQIQKFLVRQTPSTVFHKFLDYAAWVTARGFPV